MNRDRLDFGNEKIGRLFRAMFFPTLVAMVVNSVLNLCDGMFVGHGVGSDALAAINIVAPMFLICIGIGLMFGIGASVIGGIRLSENNEKAASIIMTQALTVGTAIFVFIDILCLLFMDDVLRLFGCSEILRPYATDYLIWLLPGLPFLFIQCAGMMLIRLDGAPRMAMAIQILAATFNIVLDWILVFSAGMGIKGAAVASSVSCFVAAMPVIIYFGWFSSKLKYYRLKKSWKSLRLTLRNIGYMMNISFATFVAEMAIGVMMVTGNYMFMHYLGENGVAAYSIGCYLFPVIFSITNAVAQSAQPIISFNYGARDMARVRDTLKIAVFTAVVCGVTVSAVMAFAAPLLCAVFLPSDAPAYAIAANGLPLLGSCAIFFALNITFIGYYQSIEKSARATIDMLMRGIVFLVPCFLLLPGIIGDKGLWLAIPSAELLTFVFIIVSYIVFRSRNSKNKPKTTE